MIENPTKRKVLLTGAAGRIASAFRHYEGERYALRLADRDLGRIGDTAGHEVLELDVADLEACRAACAGIDTVVHLAADPSPDADFYGSLLDNNIKGTYNVFRAARDQGCQRVIFASSIHAVIGYMPDVQARPESPVRPINMYGVSKCFGEAVAHYFAASEGLSSIAIRIGAFESPWAKQPGVDVITRFISQRDMSHLLVRCIETPDVQFAIVHGSSDNRLKLMDISSTRELLGYQPQDDGFRFFNVDLP
jgi:NAD+ dependent glucose-6-phosphate dehydrogenase